MVMPPCSLFGSARGPKLLAYLVILLVILLFLGGDRIASTGRGLGEAIRGFKKGLRGADPKPNGPAPSVRQKVPKLLPAKGESSAKNEPDTELDPEKDS
jgi:TatA/E family protein of Tat protein translocase